MTSITLEIKDCRECPKCDNRLTKGYGYALDHFCTIDDEQRITSGYVEWESDMNPVPEWCKLRTK